MMGNSYRSFLDTMDKLKKQIERREADQKEYQRISRMFKGLEERDRKEKERDKQ